MRWVRWSTGKASNLLKPWCNGLLQLPNNPTCSGVLSRCPQALALSPRPHPVVRTDHRGTRPAEYVANTYSSSFGTAVRRLTTKLGCPLSARGLVPVTWCLTRRQRMKRPVGRAKHRVPSHVISATFGKSPLLCPYPHNRITGAS